MAYPKSARAEAQLPEGPFGGPARRASSAITTAADPSLTAVKLTASIAPPRSARRQRSELPAKHTIARVVRRAVVLASTAPCVAGVIPRARPEGRICVSGFL